jgi:uncharacterized protein YecE (DUF72 family)
MPRLYAGTSGFAYASWKPGFYPPKLAAGKFLQHYATRLNAVEINYTFRRSPSAAALENWRSATPGGFLFACKAHMRITHMKRLKPSEATQEFFDALEPLRASGRLGPVLFQLPPNCKADVELLASFLTTLPTGIRATFEFRHESWLTNEIYRLLEKHGVALCLAESETFAVPPVATSDFVYVRLRKEKYSLADRREIADRAHQQLAAGRDVFVFFKHEESPEGAMHAEELRKQVATLL